MHHEWLGVDHSREFFCELHSVKALVLFKETVIWQFSELERGIEP